MPDLAATPSAREGASYAARNSEYWKRNLWICVFGSFTTLVGLTLVLPFLPLYVEKLGAEGNAAIVEWSGVAFGATFLGTALTAPLWGSLGDRYGRKVMLVRAAVGMAIIMPLLGCVHHVWQLVGLRLAAGLVGGYASSSTMLIATQAPKDKSGWALGILSTGALAGSLMGPMVGGTLASLIGIRHTLFASGAVIAVTAFLTLFFVREDRLPKRTMAAASAESTALPRALLAAMFGTAMLVLFASMSIEPIITVYLRELGAPAARLVFDAGLVMAASALGGVVMAAPLGRLADRIGAGKVIAGCLAAAGLIMLPQALVSSWWQLALLRFALGAALAGLLPAVMKVIRQAVPEQALGKVLGYAQSSQFAGQVLGPLAGGALGGMVGMRSVFICTGLLLLAGAWASRTWRHLIRI
jgi:DHA1 family multidrug resistance protein-like MFS transporter